VSEIQKSDGKSITLTDAKGKIINNISTQGRDDIPTPSSTPIASLHEKDADDVIDYGALADKANIFAIPTMTEPIPTVNEPIPTMAEPIPSNEVSAPLEDLKPRYSCGRGPHFGCGSYNCVTCYPFTYRCPDGHEYLTPVPNGEPMPDCPESSPNGDYGCEYNAEFMAQIC